MPRIADRFRGFLPVVVDVETSGFDPRENAVLEVAACLVDMDDFGRLRVGDTIDVAVAPFDGARLDPASMEFNGIDIDAHLERAVPETDAVRQLSQPIRKAMRQAGCQRAIMVAHNPTFDLGFWNAMIERTGYKRSPFHPFSSFDTATLAGLAFGQTVLARAASAAGMEWDEGEAHSAAYDARKTAELFCGIVNRWKIATGFPED